MTAKKHYERNPNFIYRKIVDESILVPIHQDVANMDAIYTLNGVGAFIWECLDQPASQPDLAKRLLTEYDADPHDLNADLEKFLTDMVAIGALLKG